MPCNPVTLCRDLRKEVAPQLHRGFPRNSSIKSRREWLPSPATQKYCNTVIASSCAGLSPSPVKAVKGNKVRHFAVPSLRLDLCYSFLISRLVQESFHI